MDCCHAATVYSTGGTGNFKRTAEKATREEAWRACCIHRLSLFYHCNHQPVVKKKITNRGNRKSWTPVNKIYIWEKLASTRYLERLKKFARGWIDEIKVSSSCFTTKRNYFARVCATGEWIKARIIACGNKSNPDSTRVVFFLIRCHRTGRDEETRNRKNKTWLKQCLGNWKQRKWILRWCFFCAVLWYSKDVWLSRRQRWCGKIGKNFGIFNSENNRIKYDSYDGFRCRVVQHLLSSRRAYMLLRCRPLHYEVL